MRVDESAIGCHGKVVAVLDIDSKELGTFDKTDALWLEKIAACVYGPQRDMQSASM